MKNDNILQGCVALPIFTSIHISLKSWLLSISEKFFWNTILDTFVSFFQMFENILTIMFKVLYWISISWIMIENIQRRKRLLDKLVRWNLLQKYSSLYIFFKKVLKPDMVAHTFNPSIQRQVDLWDFKASLVYREGSRTARVM